MISLKIIFILLIIVIIICVIENSRFYSSSKIKYKCPNTYEIYNYKTDKILIYNDKYLNTNKVNIEEYKYQYKPKILISTRLVNPFKQSIKTLKNIDKDTIATDITSSVKPYLNFIVNTIDFESGYTVLSNIPDLKIISDENYIYIKNNE